MRREPPKNSIFNKLLVGVIIAFWLTLAVGNWVGRYLIQQDLQAMSQPVEPLPQAEVVAAEPVKEQAPQVVATPLVKAEDTSSQPEAAKKAEAPPAEAPEEVAVARPRVEPTARPEPEPRPAQAEPVKPQSVALPTVSESPEVVVPEKVELPSAAPEAAEELETQPDEPAPQSEEEEAEVVPEPESEAEPQPEPAEPAQERPKILLGRQYGAFANRANADRLAEQLSQEGKNVEIEAHETSSGTLYRVKAR